MPATRVIFPTTEDVTPAAIPNAATDVIAQDVWLVLIVLTNIGAATATVTISDKQTTPVPIVKDFEVDPGVPVVIAFPANDPAYMKGGIRWVASAADTVAARMRFKY